MFVDPIHGQAIDGCILGQSSNDLTIVAILVIDWRSENTLMANIAPENLFRLIWIIEYCQRACIIDILNNQHLIRMIDGYSSHIILKSDYQGRITSHRCCASIQIVWILFVALITITLVAQNEEEKSNQPLFHQRKAHMRATLYEPISLVQRCEHVPWILHSSMSIHLVLFCNS